MLVIMTTASTTLAVVMAVLAWRLARNERRRESARIAALAAEIQRGRTEGLARVPERTSIDGALARSRTAAAIALAVFVFGIGAAVTAVLTGTTAPPAAASAGAKRVSVPLELVELGQERHGDTLAVHGVVRNPARGAQMNGVSAVVVLLNRAGASVKSGQALVENGDLAPGSESRFRVVILGTHDIARYRVSFRTDQGIAAHVDRRTTAAEEGGR